MLEKMTLEGAYNAYLLFNIAITIENGKVVATKEED